METPADLLFTSRRAEPEETQIFKKHLEMNADRSRESAKRNFLQLHLCAQALQYSVK